MGSKRSFAEVEASGSMRDAANKKRKQFTNHKPRHGGDATPEQSVNKMKKRVRDIERQFANGVELPADVQQNLERELAHCKRQVEDLQYKKKRNKMISKYHKVRFFERQKADRLKKQLKRRLDEAADAEEKAKLAKEYHIAEVDSYYPRYFPFMEPYVGLYAGAKAKEDSAEAPLAKRALHAERPPVWKEIEEAIEKGVDALESIQERRPKKKADAVDPSSSAPPEEASGKKPKDERAKSSKAKKKSESAAGMHEDRQQMLYGKVKQPKADLEDDGDGDGFFDE